MSEERKGNWIQTYTGRKFWPLDPRPEDINILDIAHALSNICRFSGHCARFYSVGEHCLHVSHAAPKELALWGLLHDAAEAYTGDLPSPIKWNMPEYKAMEVRVLAAITSAFDLPEEEPEEIKVIDKRMLITERDALFDHPLPWDYFKDLEPLPRIKILCAPPPIVANAFMQRFHNLTEGKFANEQERVIAVRNESRILLPK